MAYTTLAERLAGFFIPKSNKPKIGQRLQINGKTKIWAGDDYGPQSPESFRQLQINDQLSRGASFTRRANQTARQIVQATPEPIKRVVSTISNGASGVKSHLKDEALANHNPVSNPVGYVNGLAGTVLHATDSIVDKNGRFGEITASSLGVHKPLGRAAGETVAGLAIDASKSRAAQLATNGLTRSASRSLAPAVAGTSKPNVSTLGNSRAQRPNNVLQINANAPGSLASNKPTYRNAKGKLPDQSANTVRNRELKGAPQPKPRDSRMQYSTDYLVSDPNQYQTKYGKAFYAKAANSHHVNDVAFTGDVFSTVGEARARNIHKLSQNNDVRYGNDAFQMVTMPGAKDHQGLMHGRYYKQITARNILQDALKKGTLSSMSDQRIAKLLTATAKAQQELLVGWGKWKLDMVRKYHPETSNFSPKEMRQWFENNADAVNIAGIDEAPARYEQLSKYKALKGSVNSNNEYLRTVFDIDFNNRNAMLGREHEIPMSYRQATSKQKRLQR